ncbi:MAG: hypothetical protein M1814_006944 [Vezdaea aestivalis]|nr:MAG: hypothetical protein M1814_006944 [Vezdaea aestivalis]
MSFVIRQPLTLSSTISHSLPKALPSRLAPRAFHNSAFRSLPKTSSTTSTLTKRRTPFLNAFQTRSYTPATIPNPASATRGLGPRLLYGAAIFGGTMVAINVLFNRETREDGGMPVYEREYLNQTFMHTGLGIGIIGVAARALHQAGWSYRLMAMNPWVVMIGGVGCSIACMYGTFNTHPDNYVQKYALWTGFNVTQALVLSPLMFMSPAILARAGLYTLGMMGSIAYVGATAKQEKYLYLGGPLLAGVGIVALSGLAPLVLPVTAARTLMWSENIWLYGGLAVFGGFTLYDVQKILQHARLARVGAARKDVVNESVSLELDFLNIFIRMVQILSMRSNNRR